jgi:hypothetical protein
LFSLFLATQKKIATSKHYGMNDIKEKEQLPIVPLATLLQTRDRRTEPFFEKAGDENKNIGITLNIWLKILSTTKGVLRQENKIIESLNKLSVKE